VRRSRKSSRKGPSRWELPIPAALRPVYEQVTGQTDAVCREYLNEEYAELARRMAAVLCQFEPSPLESGKPQSWACAIVYALGKVNFLFDKTQKPHLRADALCKLFGVSPGNASPKANEILDNLGLVPMDPEWTLPSKLGDNPLVWVLSVNGVLMDIRDAPREAQEAALAQGLIPFLPPE
jgi:hypothetical protein